MPVILTSDSYGTAVTPQHSLIRPLLLAVIIACCLISVRSTYALTFPGAVARDYIIGFIFHSSNFLVVSRTGSPPDVTTPWQRLRFAIDHITDARWGVTVFPPFDERSPRYVPSRGKLFVQRLMDCMVSIALAYYIENHSLLLPSDYIAPNGFLRRIHKVSARELAVRVYLTVIGSLIPYLALRAGHSFASCIALALGDSPERWPPLFGNFSDAYNLRRWYSYVAFQWDEDETDLYSLFWHRAMRKPFTAQAAYVAHDVFGMRRKSPASRYCITALVFAQSAVMHVLTCPGRELCVIPAQIAIHMGTAGAIALEDGVISLYRKVNATSETTAMLEEGSEIGYAKSIQVELISKANETRKRRLAKPDDKRQTPILKTVKIAQPIPAWPLRLLGFSWVAAFWTWSVSNLIYSLYSC